MLLVTPNFADQENRIEHEPGDNGAKENDAKKYFNTRAPVEDDPPAAHAKATPQQNSQREKE